MLSFYLLSYQYHTLLSCLCCIKFKTDIKFSHLILALIYVIKTTAFDIDQCMFCMQKLQLLFVNTGECPACPETSIQMCQCGRNSANRPCADPVWQCTEVCLSNLTITLNG